MPMRTDEDGHRHWFHPDWPGPDAEMLKDPEFEAIWEVIQDWDINVPGIYGGYCGSTGNHVRAILEGLRKARSK